jgi:hypothetical protein
MLSVQKISSILILSHLLLLSSEIHAQQRNPIPLLPAEMTYQEYQDLNKEANWKRLIIAFFVPGYMHFYADAPAWGIAIATTRIIGGGMMAFATVDQYNYARSSNWGYRSTHWQYQSVRTKFLSVCRWPWPKYAGLWV